MGRITEIFMLWEANEARMDKGKDARRRARNRAQKPGATRKIEDKRRKAPRHSKRWQDDGTGSF